MLPHEVLDLKKKTVDNWVAAGIVSSQQANDIILFEAQKKKPIGIITTVSLGILAIGLGIVSIVASNWDLIPKHLKLASFFAIYVSSAFAQVALYHKKPVISEALRSLFFLLTIAGIGLVGQIFNLRSDGWSALAFWLAITLPTVATCRSHLLPSLWWSLYFITVALWSFKIQISNESVKLAYIATFTLAPTLVGPVLSAPTFNLFLWFRKPMVFFARISIWLFIPILIDFMNLASTTWFKNLNLASLMILFIGCLHAGIIYLGNKTVKKSLLIELTSIVFPIALLALNTSLSGFLPHSEVSGACQFIAIVTAACICSYHRKMYLEFNFLTMLIATRLIIIYFQIFGNLLDMGFGLIISGAVVIAIAYGWYKIKQRFAPARAGKKSHD